LIYDFRWVRKGGEIADPEGMKEHVNTLQELMSEVR